MKTQRIRFYTVAIVALCFVSQARAEDRDTPFVCRSFAFWGHSDLAPDYFRSDDSVAVVVLPQSSTAAASDNLYFADCEHNGALADTTWAIRTTNHLMKGNHWEVGNFYWLLTEETPEPPPEGVMTLTGSESPLIISQELIYVGDSEWPCEEEGLSLVYGGSALIIVTALFNR